VTDRDDRFGTRILEKYLDIVFQKGRITLAGLDKMVVDKGLVIGIG
jgi:hypothetical protein